MALPLGPEGPSLLEVASRYARPRGARWAPVPPELDAAIAADHTLAQAARRARLPLITSLSRRFDFNQRLLDAVLRAPRERFVLPEDIPFSADDNPLPLDDAGHATVSAPHAYLLTYELLALTEADHLIELGTGTGYGAALARRIVGPAGHVTSIEIDPALHARARRLLEADHDPTASAFTLLCGDGRTLAEHLLAERSLANPDPHTPPRANPRKIAVTYALRAAPANLEILLAEGDRLVAPIGPTHDVQDLVLVERRAGTIHRETHGAVRYVAERL